MSDDIIQARLNDALERIMNETPWSPEAQRDLTRALLEWSAVIALSTHNADLESHARLSIVVDTFTRFGLNVLDKIAHADPLVALGENPS